MKYTLNEAAKAAGKSKTTIHRAIKSGRISAPKTDKGSYAIDASELHRVFPIAIKDRSKEQPNWNEKEQSSNAAGTLRIQLENIEKERVRERELLQETIADLREDRDKWRHQATSLLEDKRPRGFWKKIFG